MTGSLDLNKYVLVWNATLDIYLTQRRRNDYIAHHSPVADETMMARDSFCEWDGETGVGWLMQSDVYGGLCVESYDGYNACLCEGLNGRP